MSRLAYRGCHDCRLNFSMYFLVEKDMLLSEMPYMVMSVGRPREGGARFSLPRRRASTGCGAGRPPTETQREL